MKGLDYKSIIQELVMNGYLIIHFINANPRSSSTALEVVMMNHPDILCAVQDPFDRVSWENADEQVAYQYIYRQIQDKTGNSSLQKLKNSINKEKPLQIIVKEMTHQIDNEKIFKEFISLTSKTVINLVRNPFLQIESRIKMMLKHIQVNLDLNLLQWLAENVSMIQDYKGMDHPQTLKHQNYLLDCYAQNSGTFYHSWQKMAEHSIEYGDYSQFNNILKQVLDPERHGWKQLISQLFWQKELGKKSMIIDATTFRLQPYYIAERICSEFDLEFTANMLKWKPDDQKIAKHQRGMPEFNIWYQRVLEQSHGIQPPIEIPIINQNMFPAYLQQYLQEALNLYIYFYLGNQYKQNIILPKNPKNICNQYLGVKRNNITKQKLKFLKKLSLADKAGFLFLGNNEKTYNFLKKHDLLYHSAVDISKIEFLKKSKLQETEDYGFGVIKLSVKEIDPLYSMLIEQF